MFVGMKPKFYFDELWTYLTNKASVKTFCTMRILSNVSKFGDSPFVNLSLVLTFTELTDENSLLNLYLTYIVNCDHGLPLWYPTTI